MYIFDFNIQSGLGHPICPVGPIGVHRGIVDVGPHVTESGEPLTVHLRPVLELQLQRPLKPVTLSLIRGRKRNPMQKFIQGWRNVLKPLANIGHKMHKGCSRYFLIFDYVSLPIKRYYNISVD